MSSYIVAGWKPGTVFGSIDVVAVGRVMDTGAMTFVARLRQCTRISQRGLSYGSWFRAASRAVARLSRPGSRTATGVRRYFILRTLARLL